WCSTPEPTRPLGREGAPLGQCRRASLLVDLAGDDMALLIEMVVDLGVNRAELLQRLRTSEGGLGARGDSRPDVSAPLPRTGLDPAQHCFGAASSTVSR